MDKNDLFRALGYVQDTVSPIPYNKIINALKTLPILIHEYNNLQTMRDAIVDYNRGKPQNKKYDPRNIDEHFHQRAFFQAGQMGPAAQKAALWWGNRKEDWDWLRNQFSDMTGDEISAERKKDLQNNKKAAIMGTLNPNVPVNVAIPVRDGSTVEAFWHVLKDQK